MKRVLSLLLILLGLTACARNAPAPAEPTAAPEPPPVLAFFGAADRPWSQAMARAARDWAKEAGWALVEYDCLDLESTMELQVADLTRSGGAEAAVICAAGDKERQEAWAGALSQAGARVITVTDRAGQEPVEAAAGHIGPDNDMLLAAAAGYFKDVLPARAGVILLHDMEEAPLESAAAKALERAGVTVRERTYTWGSVDYASDLLTAALQGAGRTGGVLCFSRTGVLGARAALEKLKRRDVKVLCLDWSRELQEDLELGRVDALAAVPAPAAARRLTEALNWAARGQDPGVLPLTADILTAED